MWSGSWKSGWPFGVFGDHHAVRIEDYREDGTYVLRAEQPGSTDEAVAQLNGTGRPFLFYLDGEHIRGSVLYRRYDGHYGLIIPAS